MMCGEMNGDLIRPYPADLGGSTFGAVKLDDGAEADISALTVIKDCEDALAQAGQ